jgi:hypothetical protein
MKSDCNGLVEQSGMNQSVDENFNRDHGSHRTVECPSRWPLGCHAACGMEGGPGWHWNIAPAKRAMVAAGASHL